MTSGPIRVATLANEMGTPEFLYFAYGSNMLTERLADRCPSARPLGVAHAAGHAIRFHKRSLDGSGKAMIEATGSAAELVPGVVFAIAQAERAALDAAEGPGYRRADDFVVTLAGRTASPLATAVYLARETDVVRTLRPFEWYRALALAGAHQHGLPAGWIARLEGVEFDFDPEPGRPTRQDALRALKRAAFMHLLPLAQAT